MVSLTNLSVFVDSPQVSLTPFGVLPMLRRLHLMSMDTSALTGDGIGLSKLHTLKVTVMTESETSGPGSPDQALSLDFVWTQMKWLQHVEICGRINLGKGILEVLRLSNLTSFQLIAFKAGNASTENYLTQLVCLFHQDRPDVDVLVKQWGQLDIQLS